MRVMHSRSLPISALALSLNSALAICLIALPAWFAIDLAKKGYVAEHTLAFADVTAMVATANLTVAIPAMVHFIAVATLLIHLPFAFILRPLYLVEGRLPLTPISRRALALAGATLLAHAFGYSGIELLKPFF